MSQQRVVVKNDLSELERVRHLVEAFGADNGIAPKAIFHLNLALDEILSNLISHAYADGAEHAILVRLAVSAGEFTAEVVVPGQRWYERRGPGERVGPVAIAFRPELPRGNGLVLS
jgi:serine/threonine-protein kinase RsbW